MARVWVQMFCSTPMAPLLQLHPLPSIVHDIGAVVAALRQMSQARHVGKVVVSSAPAVNEAALEGTWAVTGGVGEWPVRGSAALLVHAGSCAARVGVSAASAC